MGERILHHKAAWVGAFLLVVLALITFYPGLRMGFYLDDYNYLERAGRTDWSLALVQIFDPRVQTMWYRPLQAIQFFVEYQILGGNADLYHLVNMAYHAINTLLLYGLAWRISRQWLIGFASAFFFATFPVYASGVNWIGIVDPLTAVFFLLSLWFWWSYLERSDLLHYGLALGAFVLALLCKQTSVVIPVVLFLMESWLGNVPFSLLRSVRRYSPFVVVGTAFMLVQYLTQSTHTFAGVFGWQVGSSMAFILAQYLVLFFFPYGVFPSIDLNLPEVGNLFTYGWAALAVLLLAYFTWRHHSRRLLFLCAFALLTLLPVLPFPFIEHRYLYIPILVAAIFLGLVLERMRHALGEARWFSLASSVGLGLLVMGNGLAVNESALAAAEWARQLRVPFRDIERQHPAFPQNTLLYFVDPITPTTGGLGGMFFMRYGRGISVKNWTDRADLQDYAASYIYYFDETRRPREILAQRDAVTRASLPLPANFGGLLDLEGYEIPSTRLVRGEPLILILYWRGAARIDRSYTVFVHLVDQEGRMVAGYDSPPRKGQLPTTAWEPHRPYADAIVMPVRATVLPGEGYRIEMGLYDSRTQERLKMLDAQGASMGDSLVIEPVTIIEKAKASLNDKP